MPLQQDLQRVEAAMETLARVGRSRSAAERRAARAGVELPGAAQQVLRQVIDHGPVRISDLARRLHMADAAVSRQVTLLEAQRLVSRAASETDGRVALVCTTASGRRAGLRLRASADEIFRDHLAAWSARDLSQLARLIERLATDLRHSGAGPGTGPEAG